MHLYFSGVAGKAEAEMLVKAGVTRFLVDPKDYLRMNVPFGDTSKWLDGWRCISTREAI